MDEKLTLNKTNYQSGEILYAENMNDIINNITLQNGFKNFPAGTTLKEVLLNTLETKLVWKPFPVKEEA